MNNNQINIKFTDSAIDEIMNLLKEKNENQYLRIGMKDGGCAGFSYIFELDEKKEEDVLQDVSGRFEFLLNPEHLLHINNIEVDYETGLKNRGFIFNNPNAQTTCGCGTSFS